MKVIVAENHEEVSRLAADILEETVRANPCCTLGLATGSSPVGMYRELSRRCREEGLDFSRVHSVNLDEYVGLAPTHEQSYRYFMDSNLFDHINIDKANTYVANGTGDIEENLREFNAVLDRTDIDVQVLGVGPDDTPELCEKLADKALGLRIFCDEAGKMNRSLADIGGQVLVVSQFTLYADCRKGKRPSFTGAALPELAVPLYEQFLQECRSRGFEPQHGRFGADMLVASENDGPVTILLDTDELLQPRRG